MYAYIYMHSISLYIYTHLYTHIYTYIHMYMYMYIYMYACMYRYNICMYRYTKASWNGGSPKIINFNRMFHHEPTILGILSKLYQISGPSTGTHCRIATCCFFPYRFFLSIVPQEISRLPSLPYPYSAGNTMMPNFLKVRRIVRTTAWPPNSWMV